MPTPRTLAEVAVAAVLGAGLAVSLSHTRRQADEIDTLRAQVESARGPHAPTLKRLEQLERHLADRETRTPPERETPVAPSPPAEDGADLPPDQHPDRLAARIDALTAELEALKTQSAENARQLSRVFPANALVPPTAQDIPALQAAAIDLQKTEAERIAALRMLRASSPDGRSRAVVESMLALLAASQDAGIRADVCRNLKRAVPVELKDPLIRTLQTDPDAKVREEAAETLGPLQSDSGVRLALELAARNDPSEKVRSEAQGALDKGR